MQNAQPDSRTRPPRRLPAYKRSPRRRAGLWARALAAGAFGAVMLVAGGLAAQQVLMAPHVELAFDSVQVTGQTDAVGVDYQIDPNDWKWTDDFGMSIWMGLYTAQAADEPTGPWQLQQAERLDDPQGQVSFEHAVEADARRIGLCLVVANVDGGEIAPGMGYVCETPLVVSTNEGRVDLSSSNASVGLRFERHVEQQPWFTVRRGFEQAAASEVDTVQSEGEFFSYRAPSPPEAVQTEADRRGDDRREHKRRDDDRDDQRRHDAYGYLIPGGGFYVPGFSRGIYGHDRFTVDRFRQRRLRRRRMFGPLDGFDAKFDQDMFESHQEDVFYNHPITPGYFGRDAFGRDLRHGFGVPPGQRRILRRRGFGQPFD